MQIEIVWSITVWSCNQSEQLVTGRTTDRATVWPTITNDCWCDHARMNSGAITRDWWYDHVRHVCVLWSQTDRRQFWTWRSWSRTITYDHVLSRTITYDHVRSRTITYDHVRSRTITYDHVRSRTITYDHVRSRTITYDHVRSRTITYDHVRSRTITYDHVRSVARSLYNLTAIPTFFDRNLVAGLVWLWQS